MSAATAIDRGDRPYQQDQVEVFVHARVPGCVLAVVADGMGGKSGGRKASDQVMLIARQLFERFIPSKDDPADLLRRLLNESHLLIKLTAITSEQEPHSTLAACLLTPDLQAHTVHAGDSRIYHFHGPQMAWRSTDHSLVQHMVDLGQISEEQALTHPKANLLIGCVGGEEEPPVAMHRIAQLEIGDSLMVCSDGLWHYFTPREMGTYVNALKPRDACRMLITKARQRARGGGDNLCLALVRIEPLTDPAAARPPEVVLNFQA